MHFFVNCPDISHIVELNRAGMEEWHLVNKKRTRGDQLAEFPGTIFLGDHNDFLLDTMLSLNDCETKSGVHGLLEQIERQGDMVEALVWVMRISQSMKMPARHAPYCGQNSESSQSDLVATGDSRNNDSSYPSKKLDKADVKHLESEVSSHFAASGGRLYEQEGRSCSKPHKDVPPEAQFASLCQVSIRALRLDLGMTFEIWICQVLLF